MLEMDSSIVYAFSEILLLERSLVEGQKLQQKEREKRKRESDKKKTLIGAHARTKKLYNVILVKNKDAFCLSRAVLSHLELFQLIIVQKRSKTFKKMRFLGKPPVVKGLSKKLDTSY